MDGWVIHKERHVCYYCYLYINLSPSPSLSLSLSLYIYIYIYTHTYTYTHTYMAGMAGQWAGGQAGGLAVGGRSGRHARRRLGTHLYVFVCYFWFACFVLFVWLNCFMQAGGKTIALRPRLVQHLQRHSAYICIYSMIRC